MPELAVLQQARALQAAWERGTPQLLLQGKQLGVLCASGARDESSLFCLAARELGAQVSLLRHGLTKNSSAQEVRDTAQMMGRLYDAIECQRLGRALVRQIQQSAGVPVFEGLGLPSHASAHWAGELQGAGDTVDKRRFVLQAWLLREIAGRPAR